jgi:nitrogen fixation protein FixH
MQQVKNRSQWRFFPYYLIGAMLVVIAVNTDFIVTALKTFPGDAGSDDFDTSNRYDQILDLAAKQASLGWNMAIVADRDVRLTLTGKGGKKLTDAKILAEAMRPLGAENRTALHFTETAPGFYAAPENLAAGQWDILLTVNLGADNTHITQRIIAQDAQLR